MLSQTLDTDKILNFYENQVIQKDSTIENQTNDLILL